MALFRTTPSAVSALEIKAMISSYWLDNKIALAIFDAESGEAIAGATSSNPATTYDLENFTFAYAANAAVTITVKKAYDAYTVDRDGTETFVQSLSAGDSLPVFTQNSRNYILK